jgi:hypothetical protein
VKITPTLKVPDPKTDDASTAIYNYLVRYIMAAIFYALDGPDHWSNKLGFLTKISVCTWQGQVVSRSTLLKGGIGNDCFGYVRTSDAAINQSK